MNDDLVARLDQLRAAGWNQRERILWALRYGATYCTDSGVVCCSVFLQAYMPRYPVAVAWLRGQGHHIETGWCKQHRVGTYRLEH